MNGVEKGRRGEDLAAAFLLRRNIRIIARNWRCRAGEIDIIAEDSGIVVFCEVKSRESLCFGSGAEAVDCRKQRRILRAASLYLQRMRWENRPCRFDIVEILRQSSGQPEIHHIPDAFGR